MFVVRLSVTFAHKAGRSMLTESAVDGLAEWLYEVFEQRALSGLDHYFGGHASEHLDPRRLLGQMVRLNLDSGQKIRKAAAFVGEASAER